MSDSDCSRVATFLCLELQSEPQENYIKKFGFNHIIIIRARYCGLLFLDCYGRVFKWENSMSILWSLEDYSSIASKEFLTRRVIWDILRVWWNCYRIWGHYGWYVKILFIPFFVLIFIISSFLLDLPNELTFDKPATKTVDVQPVAKKKKNSKKKNSKQKQHWSDFYIVFWSRI